MVRRAPVAAPVTAASRLRGLVILALFFLAAAAIAVSRLSAATDGLAFLFVARSTAPRLTLTARVPRSGVGGTDDADGGAAA